MNELQYYHMLQSLNNNKPTLDDKVKSMLPGALFGGALGGTAGSIVGDALGNQRLGAIAGTGAGAFVGAKPGIKNPKKDKGFLATNAESLGAGVAGNFMGDYTGRAIKAPIKYMGRSLKKQGELKTDVIDYFKLNPKAKKNRSAFSGGNNKLKAGYNSKKLDSAPLKSRLSKTAKAEVLSKGAPKVNWSSGGDWSSEGNKWSDRIKDLGTKAKPHIKNIGKAMKKNKGITAAAIGGVGLYAAGRRSGRKERRR